MESSEGEKDGSAADDEWSEGFPRKNWMAGCTESGSNWSQEDVAATNHLRMSNPRALQEKVLLHIPLRLEFPSESRKF